MSMWFPGVSCPGCSRAASGVVNNKEPLKKAKTPQGRFDSPEEKPKDVLESENYAGDLLSWFGHKLHSVV